MNLNDFLFWYLSETSRIRLAKHCREDHFQISSWDGSLRDDGSVSDKISSIMLWGAPGRIVLKTHFALATANEWAARAAGKPVEEIQEAFAVDFMREFSNLHAGSLRGQLEAHGLLFGISLPFIMAGNSERTLRELAGTKTATRGWLLTDGAHHVVCTAELEIADSKRLERVRGALEAAVVGETAAPADDGEIQFL
jgi:hypothetical protein